jgi:hypothetical protein
MTILGRAYDQRYEFDPKEPMMETWGVRYGILKCPACKEINLASYIYYKDMEYSGYEIPCNVLYPQQTNHPIGLPENISKAYSAAEKVKNIDIDAYAIYMRKLLELVCLDRGASQGTLAEKLKILAKNNEIPQKLVKIADGLRNFGNIGAHVSSEKLTEEEKPLLNALCRAILEYVYSAPYLAEEAENKLNEIKNR